MNGHRQHAAMVSRSPDVTSGCVGWALRKNSAAHEIEAIAMIKRTAVRRRFAIVCLIVSILAGLYACKSRPRDPVAEVEAFITKVEQLTEARDLAGLKEVIHEDYQGSHGLNKRRVISLLQLQFLKRKKIHVISRVIELEVTEKDTSARVDLLAGLAGQPIEGLLGLKDVRADIMRFKIRLRYDGDDWLVQRVDWSRARLSDFLEFVGD